MADSIGVALRGRIPLSNTLIDGVGWMIDATLCCCCWGRNIEGEDDVAPACAACSCRQLIEEEE